MKKLTLLAFTLFLSIYGFGQLSAVDYTSEDFAQFKASKTYFVKSGNPEYDSEIESAANSTWKITPFEFIDLAGMKTKIVDKAASFVVLVTISGPSANQNYHYLALINGGRKNIEKYGYDDMLAYCPINHWVDETDNSLCAFRVRNMLESMIDAISIVQKNDIKGNGKKIVDKLMVVYNAKSPKIKTRTLLFCQESIGPKLQKSDIAGVYPFKFEICDKKKLAQVIKDKSTEYYYYQPGITLNKCMQVVDPSNGEVVFFDYQMMGLSINKGNIEDLVKTIKGQN